MKRKKGASNPEQIEDKKKRKNEKEKKDSYKESRTI